MQSSHPRHHAFLPGFTVIELLVVAAIVALLLGIAVPVLGRARRSAQALQSLANLRQLAQLTELYKNDHKGLFPRPAETYPRGHGTLPNDRRIELLWYNALDPYAGLVPPTTVAGKDDRNDAPWKQSPIWREIAADNQAKNHSFKMNDNFYDDDNGRYQTPETMVRHPAHTVFYGDGRAEDLENANSVSTNSQFSMTEGIVGPRNPGKTVNIVFVDGHASAESQPLNTASCPGWYSETDKKGGKDRTLIWDFTKR